MSSGWTKTISDACCHSINSNLAFRNKKPSIWGFFDLYKNLILGLVKDGHITECRPGFQKLLETFLINGAPIEI
jgi:hypothetical protein